MSVPSRTIKITGVPEELLELLDEPVRRRHALGRSEYRRELIRKDLQGNQQTDAVSFRELLAPIHDETELVVEANVYHLLVVREEPVGTIRRGD